MTDDLLNEELQSEWSKYLAIRFSGYIEQSIRVIFENFITNKAEVKVAKFAKSKSGSFQNPNPEKIIELLNSFDISWSEKLEEYWYGERKEAISSLINNRHVIAHGRHIGTGLSTMKQYCKAADEVVVYIHDLVLQ